MGLLAEGRRRIEKRVLARLAEISFVLWQVEFEDDVDIIRVVGWTQIKHPHQSAPRDLRLCVSVSVRCLYEGEEDYFFAQLRSTIVNKLAQAFLDEG